MTQWDHICTNCKRSYGAFDYHVCGPEDASLLDAQSYIKGGNDMENGIKSNGGPSSYYDFDPSWNTWNDLLEHKAQTQWGALAIHLKDVGKAFMRFGAKAGTSNAYDARKLIYSGLRLLGMIEGKQAMRAELLALLDDPQFK